jgi:RNA polymerase subunit RPABC4/transcription elongation factor Spt4
MRRPSREAHPREKQPRNSTKDWYCSHCAFTIYGHKDRCGKCGTTRLSQEASIAERAALNARHRELLAKAKLARAEAETKAAKAEEAAKLASSLASLDESKDSKVSEEEASTLKCIICWERKKAVTFVPCGHFALCRTCANKILKAHSKQCPMCRGEVVTGIETFG